MNAIASALVRHYAYGSNGKTPHMHQGVCDNLNELGCADWRQQAIFKHLPTWAEQLAQGFIHVANKHGNAAGNRWLRANTAGLIEPAGIYRAYHPISNELKSAAGHLVKTASTTIKGIRAASEWLRSTDQRLMIGGHNATHDDEALVDYAQAQATAISDTASRLIARIAPYNRKKRLGMLTPPAAAPVITGATLSGRYASYQTARARQRNPLSPPRPVGSLQALTLNYIAPMSLSTAELAAIEKGQQRALAHGIAPPSDNLPMRSQLARLSCSLWWRRQLRVAAGRAVEQVMREAHRVHRKAGIYCSHQTVARRRSQRLRNNALLETLEAINQEGQTYTLAELAELGLANPDHRRAELMLRIRDTENEARHLGHVGILYTITTPSRFHPVYADKCRRNRKYDGSTPREAQAHLNSVWAKVRASLARRGVGVYGVRVVEPHHDGTPHWHMLIWMEAKDEALVTETLREYAEEESPDELFNRFGKKTKARFDAMRIDYKKGTAAGYVAKYISKNINGEQFMDMDNYGHEMTTSAPRIEAWASVWGIRQFQFFGLPSVTVWREVRRLTERQEDQLKKWEAATHPHPCAAERFAQIRQAANAGEWDRFIRLMGGPMTARKDQPVHPWTEVRMTSAATRSEFSVGTGEEYGAEAMVARGRYGEEQKVTFGVIAQGKPGKASEYVTRLYKWEVRPKSARAAEWGEGLAGGREAASAWTRVTNCTGHPKEVDIEPRKLSPAEQKAQLEHFKEWTSSEEYRADRENEFQDAITARETAKQLFAPAPPRPKFEQIEEYMPPELEGLV